MKTAFRKSFLRDIKRLGKDEKLLGRIRDIILEVEAAGEIQAIANLKKLKAEGSYYRIRSGKYRLGLIIDGDSVTFVRALHRSEIYRYFP
ncbi:MAG: type II toxin-antitoxin system RelE/ParE family toxin [Desulfococcus multivorans]|jgi:mRNA interferase RelE/StbE|nr:type II toxin-antitoxin system RelE/ParE family toxin [Desulfococcus multivorans]